MDIKPKQNRFEKSESKPEKKKVEKIVSGTITTKKKTEVSKFADAFRAEDMKSVGKYLLTDVLFPAFKRTISDLVKNGIDMYLYGDSKPDRSKSGISKISYRSYYDSRESDRRESERELASRYSFDDVIFDNRGEAEDVLRMMDELIETYGNASIADFYDLVGITGNYTDNKYGWTNISTAKVVRVSNGGYMIKFPITRALTNT